MVEENNGNGKVTAARHDERILALEQWRKEHGKEHAIIMETLEAIRNRPSWAVTVVITSMASAIVYLLTQLAQSM